MLVNEIMTKNVVSIESDKSVKEACDTYQNHRIGCLVVTENERPVGIVTERDIIERIILLGKDPTATKVKTIMSTDLKMIPATATVKYAAETMMKYKIKKLPIVQEDTMVGIITVTDISRAIKNLPDIIICEGYPFKFRA